MNIICKKEEIEKVVSKVEKITAKNHTLPVLKGIFFDVREKILLKSTNLDLGIEIEIEGKIINKGEVVVDGPILNSLLSNISNSNEKISFELKENLLLIKGNNIETKISTLPKEDFPRIPRSTKEACFLIKPKVFSNTLKSVWFSASNSNIKPELSGVYIYKDGDKLVFVATDSFRLSEKSVLLENQKEFEPFIIPTKNIPEIIRSLEDIDDEKIKAIAEDNQISFVSKKLFLTSRIVNGNFPDYKQIIPKEIKTEVVVLKEEMINSLKTTNIFADKFNQILFVVKPNKKIFSIKSKNQERGESLSNLDAVLKGDDIEIGFNFRYIMDVFSSINSDSLSLSLAGPGKPMIIKGISDSSFLYIVMPMNK